MILLAGVARTSRDAGAMARSVVASGAARRRFMDIVAAQGGDVRVLDNPAMLPRARHVTALKAPRSGVVSRADAREIGIACNRLGAGRVRMDDTIDPAVG